MRKPKEETRDDEARAWELRSRGWTCDRIADEIGVTRSAAWKMLQRVEARVLADLKEKVEGQKARQTAVLERIIEEAALAWEKSKENAQTVTKRTVTEADGDGKSQSEEVVTQQVRGQCGDASFLSELRAALADLRKIWGLDSASSLDLNIKGTSVVECIVTTREQAEQAIATLADTSGVPRQ